MASLYDSIGRTYTATRRPDPRIAAAVQRALGDARTVVNVGAGTGSYEPRDRAVTAVEPSEVMIAQRGPDAARVVRAQAERLPFADGAFDASMALLSDHHWRDRAQGLRELRRVAPRVVVFSWDPSYVDAFWLTRDYLPSFRALPGMTIPEIAELIGATRVEPVPLAHDCRDGFLMAFWRRPEAYLDATVRAGISVFARVPAQEVEDMVAGLRLDLDSGEWERRNAAILDRDELDLGYRLIVASPDD